MTAATMTRERFDLGRVIQRTFSVLGRNLASFYLLALALGGVPSLLLQWLNLAGGFGTRTATGLPNPTVLLIGLLSGFVGLFTAFLVQGSLVWGTIEDIKGRRAALRDLLRVGLRSWLPLLGISICLGCALVVGAFLLLIPALIMMTMWSVVVPCEVVERKGVFGAFTRSRALTRGNRWAIFGLLVIYFIALVVGGLVIGAVIGVIFYGGVGPAAALAMAGKPMAYLGTLVATLATTFLRVIGAVGVAALYYELRSAKEGVGPEALADVFS